MPPACTHVIFDLDGTLLDSEALYSVAAETVCARYGAQFTLAIKRRIMGGDTLSGARVVVETLGLPITPEAYAAERKLELLRLIPSVRAMPGAERLVETLRAQQVPLIIATSGHRQITEQKLAGHPFLRSIEPLVCGDDPRLLHGKPAPDIFLLAARELRVSPQHCVVLEDTVNGVRAGVAAGMHTIAIIDPRFGFVADDFVGAAHAVSSLEELTLQTLALR